jgi:hypothetical protein
MTDRPTPEQIARKWGDDGWCALQDIEQHGYVIVHPDEIPSFTHRLVGVVRPTDWHRVGWNDCRRHIFGPEGEQGTTNE